MDLSKREQEFKDRISDGTRSLLLSGFLLSDEERARIRNLPSPRQNCWYHLQLAVFLYDFFFESDGGSYTNLQSPIATYNLRDGLDYVWKAVYGCGICENEDEQMRRLRSIKTKCWILKDGRTSDVWRRLRDVVHFAKDNDDIESRCDVTDRDFFRLVDLLADGAHVDNIQQWQSKVPREEFEVWKMWIEACNRNLGMSQSAYVDWYLRIDNNDRAQYIAGFDGFPSALNGAEGWREFDVNQNTKRIPSSFSWAESIPWRKSTTIKYNGVTWNTLKSSEQNDAMVDESCLFHSADDSFGVFVRYRSDDKDPRHCWWKRYGRNEQIEIGSRQSYFLVCGRNKEKLNGLKIIVPEKIECVLEKEGEFEISYDDDRQKFPFRIYRINQRPKESAEDIGIFDGDREVFKIKVYGKTSHITADVGDEGWFVTAMGKDSRCVSTAIDMKIEVQSLYDDSNYEWTLTVGGNKILKKGKEISILSKELCSWTKDNSIASFALRCQDNTSRRIIGRVKGIVIPDTIICSLKGDGTLPKGWEVENVNHGGISAILDRIEGFSRVLIKDPNGVSCEIGVPDNGIKWWFEDGYSSFSDMANPPLLHDSATNVEEFSSQDIWTKSLCFPPDVKCDSDKWYLISSYFRCPVSKLIDISNFCYDPNRKPISYRLSGSNINLFKYHAEPNSVRLCKDVKDRIGVYVPEETTSSYIVIAFSDKTYDLLLSGKHLAEVSADNRFTVIQDEWNRFCQETEGYDALLAVLQKEGSAVANGMSIFSLSSFSDYEISNRLLLRSGAQGVVYDDSLLPTVNLLKNLMCDLPVDHPIRNMYFFSTLQQQTAQKIKDGWGNQVSVLVNIPCLEHEKWEALFVEWIQSGFDPIVEGVAHKVYEKILYMFLCNVPLEDPFDRIDQNAGEWTDFMKGIIVRNRKLRQEDVQNIPFWPDGVNKTKNRKECFIQSVNVWHERWRQFREQIIKQLGGQECDPRKVRDIQAIFNNIYIAEDNRIRRVVNCMNLNNNVREGEMQVQNLGLVKDNTPSKILKGLFCNNDLSKVYLGILDLLSERRNVGNLPNDNATDREWLFCMAAVTSLIGGNEEIDKNTREVLMNIMRLARQDNDLWNMFVRYQTNCYSIVSALN